MIISMLVLGIYCEDIHDDSSFSRVSDQYRAVSLQSADHLADTHAYYEKGAFRLIEEYVLTRQTVRPHSCRCSNPAEHARCSVDDLCVSVISFIPEC